MARAKLNPVLEALQGAIGDLIFKQYGDRIVVSKKPDMSRRVLSAKQEAHHERVKRAAAWGRTARDTPDLAAVYEAAAAERAQAVYHIAFRDAMRAPEIETVDTDGFSPLEGGVIRITARDDFEIVRVEVEWLDTSGAVRLARDAQRVGDRWECAIGAGEAKGSAAVRVRASDRPGNTAEQHVDLDDE